MADALREAIADVVAEDTGDTKGYLTGYVLVAEWADADGRRTLTATARDANDENPPVWTVKGWLWQALDQADGDEDD